jgi:hypothetical protein
MYLAKKKKKRSAIAAYADYIAGLQGLAAHPPTGDWRERVEAALNGEASAELRRLVPLKTRRRFGAFFTGSKLATNLISRCTELDGKSLVYDPSVGMGDLLLAAARRLPRGRTVNETLRQWGYQLTGTDIHPEFIEGAKTRLVILAQQLHGLKVSGVESTTDHFPGIRVADGLVEREAYAQATHLTLNPPFVVADAPADCKWAGGRITQAAVFVITALERAQFGTEVVAILPDVLRSGSFTEQWRRRVAELAEVRLVEPYGIFDESADVDVFVLRVARRAKNSTGRSVKWTTAPAKTGTTIGNYFDVHVGRVVPHRDPEEGKTHHYIHARCVPTWKIMREFTESRRHVGKAYNPPFVVIRRTSRPGDAYRATGTIIAGKRCVAVENHLIVCEPRDYKLATCRKLMTRLKTMGVNEFLNARIRCRHLTVGAVKEIPW